MFVQAVAAALAVAAPLPSGRTGYRDLPDYENDMAALVAAHPASVRRVVIGSSVEGRPLDAVEIADGVNRTGDGRPVAMVIGLLHGREWPSGEMTMEFARQLAADGGRFARLRARVRTLVLPVANPDGYVISRTTDPMRRTNARGVDLNRNGSAFWGGPDASDDPASERYRGPGPLSEPESRAIRDYSARHQVAVIDVIHGYGGAVLYQPGFRDTDEPGLPAGTAVPGRAAFQALARRMAADAGYTAESAAYPSDITGGTEDFNYFNQFATAYTIEVGHGAFQPPFSQVEQEYPGVAAALVRAGEAAERRSTHAVLRGTAPPGRILRLERTVRTPTSYVVSGGRTGASRTLVDRLSSTLTVPASGRFTWAVNPSVRPLDVLARRSAAWTLRCGSQRLKVTLRLGERRSVRMTCRTQAAPPHAQEQPAG